MCSFASGCFPYKKVYIGGYCRDNGKENGNYYLGFWGLGFRVVFSIKILGHAPSAYDLTTLGLPPCGLLKGPRG